DRGQQRVKFAEASARKAGGQESRHGQGESAQSQPGHRRDAQRASGRRLLAHPGQRQEARTAGVEQKTTTNPAEIALWDKLFADASNTGVLTRLAPTLDIDILNPEAAKAVEELVRERFEERGFVLVRIGKAPKRAIPFRTDTPFKKIVANLIAPDGSEQK